MKRKEESADPGQPVTMAMVAREAGLSRSAVSYALRNHPSIPERTCRRVQELAARMGYRRNAYVSALMAQVQRKQVDGSRPTMAWLVDGTLGPEVLEGRFYRNLLDGARERAGQLGYTLQCFQCNDGKISFTRLGKVLRSRGIHGLVVGPVSNRFPEDTARFPFGEFACSTIGYSLRNPVLHRVGIDYSQGMQLVWDKVLEAGFTRPGLLISTSYDKRTNYHLRGMYMALQASGKAAARIPPCLFDGDDPQLELVLEWITRNQPDAILCGTYHRVVEAVAGLGRKGAFPALFWINHGQTLPIPGIVQPEFQLGTAAVDLVVGQIHRNEKGIPDTPNLTLIPYKWIESPAPEELAGAPH